MERKHLTVREFTQWLKREKAFLISEGILFEEIPILYFYVAMMAKNIDEMNKTNGKDDYSEDAHHVAMKKAMSTTHKLLIELIKQDAQATNL